MLDASQKPLPDSAEKYLLALVQEQAVRIDSLCKQVESREKDSLSSALKAQEYPLKYSQLALEARIGLWKVVAVAIAVVIVTGLLFALVWFRHAQLAELLRADRQPEAAAVVPAPKAAGAETLAASSAASGASPVDAKTSK